LKENRYAIVDACYPQSVSDNYYLIFIKLYHLYVFFLRSL